MSTTTTNVPATVNNNPDLAALSDTWMAAQSGSADYLWKFSQRLLKFVTASPKITQTEIGAALAVSAGRATAYSKTWVSRALKAARETPEQPTIPASATAFVDLFYGNVAREKKAKKSASTTAQEAYKAGIAFLRRAERLGMDTEEIIDGVSEEFASSDSSSQTQAA